MVLPNFFRPKKSISEIEEESEVLEAEDRRAGLKLSVAQKRQATVALRQHGLKPSHFSFDYKKIISWLKSH